MDNQVNQDALVTVFARNSFYKRLHFLALGTFALALMVIGFLLVVLMFLVKNPTHPLYFATDNVGRLINITPVDRPNMSNDEVGEWVRQAVEAAYSYDYMNFRAQFQDAEKYFTAYGWSNYMRALKASNNLVALQERQMIVMAKAVAKPRLLNEGILSGSYAWQFQVPVLVTYLLPPYDDKQESRYSNSLEVTVIVHREPILESYRGLGVLQIVSRFASASTLPQQPTAGAPG